MKKGIAPGKDGASWKWKWQPGPQACSKWATKASESVMQHSSIAVMGHISQTKPQAGVTC